MKHSLKGVFLVIFTLFFLSCMDNCLDDSSEFRMRFEIQSTGINKMDINYKTTSQDDYLKNQVVGALINTSDEHQFVEFCFPYEPTDIKINLYGNVKKGSFKILNILFENNKEQLFLKQDKFYLYFKESDNMIFNKNSRVYTINDFKEVSFTSRDAMKRRLKNKLKP